MGNAKSYVLIQYTGEKNETARLESGGEKVSFKKGDVQFAQDSRAKHLCGAYKFEQVNPVDMSPEMLKSAQKRLDDIVSARGKQEKEQEEIRKKEEARQEKEKEMRLEIAALKDKYNRREIDNDKYQEEKEKVVAKWEKVFEAKDEKKKKEVKEDVVVEAPEEVVEE